VYHPEYQNVPDDLSDWPAIVSHAPSQRTHFLHPITFILPLIPLPIEFNHFLKLAHILLYRITYMFAYRDGLGE